VITFGAVQAVPLSDRVESFTSILWGSPGCGKTTLAYTAPKPILFIQFDTGGTSSLKSRNDVIRLDLSGESDALTDKFKSPDTKEMKELERSLIENEIKTIVLDSVTSFADKAFAHAIKVGVNFAKGNERVSLEAPGFTGYGIKNMLVTQAIRNLLSITVRSKTNFIVIAHEDLPTRDHKTNTILHQTLNLGSSLAFEIPREFNEVWHMSDMNGSRKVLVRPKGYLKPIKTRMFDTTTSSEFVWKYNPVTDIGEKIEDWYTQWQTNNFNKIGLPK